MLRCTCIQEYDKVVKDSSEKVKLANQVYDLVCSYWMCMVNGQYFSHCPYAHHQLDRHMRRLDHDLNRFTIELEADTAGITELLEQSTYANCDTLFLSCHDLCEL